ncbi:hypothetical protein [Arundinibacter roseus]|uniref:TMF family protein n=1 Tax=Arundinibacter roseus TaxID=2070510 RepID=A0A4R4KDV1_9BACT|nr:hypothetical protein [Arundinibacter roseus]TDB65833.1 hypothetical protein EZE20_08680 [Arundinibacter roseus]
MSSFYEEMKVPFYLLIAICVSAGTTKAQSTIRISSPTTAGFGNETTIVGANAGASSTGNENAFFGYNSGTVNTTGWRNTFLGSGTGHANTIGESNTFVGASAGRFNQDGSNNVFLGHYAGFGNTVGVSNTFSGSTAGQTNSSGSYNSFFGFGAGYNNSGGMSNSFFGTSAGSSNNNGANNTFLGMYAASFNTSGSNNTVVGYLAGQRGGVSGSIGANNVFVGDLSGYNSSGNSNTLLGSEAGLGLTSGTQATLVGAKSNVLSNNLLRATAIGYDALVGVNYGLVLGDTVHTKVGIGTAFPDQRFTLRGNINFLAHDNSIRYKNQPFIHWDDQQNLAFGPGTTLTSSARNSIILGNSEAHIGIGTNTPSNRLEINSGAEGYSGLTFSQLRTNLPPNSQTAARMLSVSETGEVVLVAPRVQLNSPEDWADHVLSSGYKLPTLETVAQFLKNHQHLPQIPSASEMTQQGMDLATLAARLVEKLEELTLYAIQADEKYRVLEHQQQVLMQRLNRLEKTQR